MEKEKVKETKQLDKIRDDDSPNRFSKKVEIAANIKSLSESINTLYVLLGKANEATELDLKGENIK